MEDLSGKPPKSAREYYIKVFCNKKKSKNKRSKGGKGIRKALKTWWSLSEAERQPFVDKFNLIQEKYKENCIKYLNSVEPFMKRKVIRDNNSDHCVTEPSNEENHLQPVVDSQQDLNESIFNENSDNNNEVHAASAIDPDSIDPASTHDTVNATEETSRIPEPIPPCTKNGMELFEMVNNAMGRNNLEWKDLSPAEKDKYRSAVLAIKREYIKEYQKYVESLPPKELFQHYIKTLEKYKLFYFIIP